MTCRVRARWRHGVCSLRAGLVVASRENRSGAGQGQRFPAHAGTVAPVIVDDVVADGEPGPVRDAQGLVAEHPRVVEARITELGFRLFPQRAFLGWCDGMRPGIYRSGKGGPPSPAPAPARSCLPAIRVISLPSLPSPSTQHAHHDRPWVPQSHGEQDRLCRRRRARLRPGPPMGRARSPATRLPGSSPPWPTSLCTANNAGLADPEGGLCSPVPSWPAPEHAAKSRLTTRREGSSVGPRAAATQISTFWVHRLPSVARGHRRESDCSRSGRCRRLWHSLSICIGLVSSGLVSDLQHSAQAEVCASPELYSVPVVA